MPPEGRTVITLEEAEKRLQQLQEDPGMKTPGRYSPSASDWPNNELPFVELHMAYLRKNKHVDPEHYLSNLRLMIRRK